MNLYLSIFKCIDVHEIQKNIEKALQQRIDLFPESKDSVILLKPNCNSNMNALTGNTTDLRVIVGVIKFLKKEGFKNIIIGEGTSSGFYHNNVNVINRLKINKIAEKFNVDIIDFNKSSYKEIDFGDGFKAKIAEICFEADFFINLPKLKTHFEAEMSVSLKNLVGCLVGLENKQKVHDSLYRNILKLNEQVRPDIHIVDGIIAMEGNGPSAGTPINMGLLLVGSDPFLVDLACAELAGINYIDIPCLRLAENMGHITQEYHKYISDLQLKKLQIKLKQPKINPLAAFINHPNYRQFFTRIRLSPGFDYLFSTKIVSQILIALEVRQEMIDKNDSEIDKIYIDLAKCHNCGICLEYCPMGLNDIGQLGKKSDGCIGCLYCFFVCPKKAIKLEGDLGFLSVQINKYDTIVREMVKNQLERRKINEH